jgi:hypothetical protein
VATPSAFFVKAEEPELIAKEGLHRELHDEGFTDRME